jgi:hypothetical protein
MNESTSKNRDGLRIITHSWYPENKPRGMVAIIPGFDKHRGYYSRAAKQFNDIDKETVMNDVLDLIDDHMSESDELSLKQSAVAGLYVK